MIPKTSKFKSEFGSSYTEPSNRGIVKLRESGEMEAKKAEW